MLDDIQNSIKAKLYDFTYTPFMSSVVISWVILNHKYLLIYFADFDLDKKLPLLKNYDFAFHCCGYYLPCASNFWFPIIFGLFYVYGYPRISKEFYEYTLKRTKELKGIKQSIEDETPMTLSEAREIRKLASILEEEKDRVLKNLGKKDEEWQAKLDNELGLMNVKMVGLNSDVVAADVKITNLETERDTLQNEKETLRTDLTQLNQFLSSKNDECEQLKIEIEQLKKKISLSSPTLLLDDKSNSSHNITTTKAYGHVMDYLHRHFEPMREGTLVNIFNTQIGIPKTLAKKIFHSLVDANILYMQQDGYYDLTKEGIDHVIQYVEDHEIQYEEDHEIPF